MVLEHNLGYHTCSLYREHDDDRIELADLWALTAPSLVRQAVDADADVHFLKTHELPGSDTSPTIYVVRDGRDAVVSFAHYLIDFVNPEAQYAETLRGLVELPDWYGGWSQNVESWTRRPNTVLVKYEDLVADPIGVTREAVARFGLLPEDREVDHAPDFVALHQQSPRFFRQGKVGGWKREMDPDLEQRFWQQHGRMMDELGYARLSRAGA